MKSIPRFDLYGDEKHPSWVELINIEQIPERSRLFNWEIEPHVHEGLVQVLFLTAGGGEVLIDDQQWVVHAPCLIVVPAQSVHGFHFLSDVDGPVVTAAQRPLETLVNSIAPDLLHTIRRPAVLQIDDQNRHLDSLMPLFIALRRESVTTAEGKVAATMSLLAALFVQIARISAVEHADARDVRSRKAQHIERFRALLDAHFRARWSVADYAQALGVTAGQLGRLCRDVLGMSPLDAVNARVLYEARRQLVYSSLSIKQVAAELGFEDEAYFGRFFKKHCAQRPSEFRLRARRDLNPHSARDAR